MKTPQELRRIAMSLLFLALPAGALHGKKLAQFLSMTSYSIMEGLPSNQINVIYQDSRGYLWIGTNNGLSVYDGTTFTNYSAVQGLPNNWVTGIVEDRSHPGTLWIGTIAGGICLFEDGKFNNVTSPGNVNALFQDRQGALWFVMNDTLFRLEKDRLTVLRTALPSERGEVIQLANGLIAAGLRQEITFHKDDGRCVYILHLPEQPRTDVYSMVQSRDGDLWVVTTAMAIYRYRDSLLVHVYQLNDVVPFQIIEDGPGNFLLRTDKGVLEFTGDRGPAENANSFAIEDILPGGWGGPIIIDREKTLWAGTWTRGLLKIADRRLINFSVPAMAGCVADTSGHLWFGDAKGLVEVYTDNEGGWYSHHHSIGKIGDARLSPQWQCDSRGRLWFSLPGSPPSLRCYRIDSHPHQPSSIVSLYDIKLPRGDFWSFLVDRQDRCWLLLGALTATIIDLATMKNVRVFTTADGLPQARAYTLFQDRRDNVWIGTWASGLARINAAGDLSGKFRIFTVSDGLPHDGVRSISEDSDGDILIGTRHGGLAILSGETKFTVVSMASGLLSNSVWRVTEDSLRRLWVHTDVGLECIDRTSLKPLPMKPEFRGERAGGLGVYGGSYLWSYSAGGVKILEYTRPSPPLVPPPVYLTSMHVNGTPQLLDGDLSFPHDRDNCTMEFVCLSFREESTVRYQYRLLGHDTLWSPSTKLRAVTFDALVPGSYRFQVRAFTLAGATSGTPAMIDFTIRPPFWSTWWFTSAIIMTAGGVLMLLYRYRIEKIREVERLRIRIASDLHDDVGSTLTKIAVHSEVIQTTAIPERIMKSSKEIGDMSREIITALSDIVWSIDARHDVLVDLIDRMRSFALETLTAKEVRVKFSTDGVIPTTKLAPNIRQNLYLIFKEAITNIAKHSAATDVLIRITQSGSGMTLVIEDNGAGLQAVPDGSGHGLKNMKMRAERIGGELNFHTDRGLRIVLVLK